MIPSTPEDQPERPSLDVQEEAPPGAPSPPLVEPAPSEPQTPPAEQAPVGIRPEVEIEEVVPVPEVPGIPVARDITFSQVTVDLLRFVRFTDFIPYDYNDDGIVDILALTSRLSTGYGFSGIGNGLFTEGPSFDLPFRPVAAVPLGISDNMMNGLFLVSATGTVSLFYPCKESNPSTTSGTVASFIFRVDTVDGPVFAVHGEDETSVRIYLLVNGELQDKGEYPALRTRDLIDWYNRIMTWSSPDDQEPFPLPPVGMERTARIADLNSDLIPDLIYYNSGKIVFLLSWEGEPLVKEQTVPFHTRPVAVRIADVDNNGFPDVLALIGQSGTLEVYLVAPSSRDTTR